MSVETPKNNDPPGGNPKDYRKAVEARKQEEAEALAAADKKKKPSKRDTTSFDFQCFELGEYGDGLIFADANRRRLVYNYSTGEWLFFPEGAHHWEIDFAMKHLAYVEITVCSRLGNLADKLSERIGAAAKDDDKDKLKNLQIQRDKILKRIKQLRGVHRRNNCVLMAISNSDPIAIEGSEIDQKPNLLPGRNGVRDLGTCIVKPGDPSDFLLKAAPHDHLEIDFDNIIEWQKTVCPKWIETLNQCLDGRQDVINYFQRALGSALFGEVKERVLFILYGPNGSNGKSLLASVICDVLGELASFILPEILLDPGRFKPSSAPTPDQMSLMGLRVVFCSEPDEKQRFSIAQVKKQTGGDFIRARNPHDRRETCFKPSHAVFLLLNILPKVFINDPAFWGRISIIDFPVSFVEHPNPEKKELPINKNLLNELKAEAPGILSWMCVGALDYLSQGGLNPPAVVRNSVTSYRDDQDLLYGFLESCCLQGEDLSVGASDLYAAFENYYLKNIGRKAPRQKSFGALVSKRFAKEKVSGYIRYIGLDLIPGWEQDDLGR